MTLQFYVDAWRQSADSILQLDLGDDVWDRPSDLARWRARDVLAHLVHLERVLAEGESGEVESTIVAADYTNAGVDALRSTPVATLRDDFARLIETRAQQLTDLPEDGSVLPPRTPAGAPWDTETLLRNRAFDMWTHEQDIRRAVERPGNGDAPGGLIATMMTAAALPYVVGKVAKAPIGSSVRFVVTEPHPVDQTVAVGDDGRARVLEAPAVVDVTLTMDTDAFTRLGAGRGEVSDIAVDIEGDADLGRRVLASMAITP